MKFLKTRIFSSQKYTSVVEHKRICTSHSLFSLLTSSLFCINLVSLQFFLHAVGQKQTSQAADWTVIEWSRCCEMREIMTENQSKWQVFRKTQTISITFDRGVIRDLSAKISDLKQQSREKQQLTFCKNILGFGKHLLVPNIY